MLEGKFLERQNLQLYPKTEGTRVQRKGLGVYFFYLFKYLATFGSASPACTKGTTLEREKEHFWVFNFLALNKQRLQLAGAPTSTPQPHLSPHSLFTSPGGICGGYTMQLTVVTAPEDCSSPPQQILITSHR